MLKKFIEIPYTNGVLTTDGVTLKINEEQQITNLLTCLITGTLKINLLRKLK